MTSRFADAINLNKIICILLMCMVSGGLSSAIAQITGTVTDSTGEPLIGATVMISGTSPGTSADLDGNFSIDAK